MFGNGDFVATRWTATGTHRGVLMGIPPTERRAVTHGCTVAQFRNGKGVHDWIYWDTGNLLRQLGVMPGPK
jgi:predicted ester cyclase